MFTKCSFYYRDEPKQCYHSQVIKREYLCDILDNKKIVGFNKMTVLDVREPDRCKDFRKLDRLQISQKVQSFHSGACGVTPKHSLHYVLALETHKRRTATVREVVIMFTHRSTFVFGEVLGVKPASLPGCPTTAVSGPDWSGHQRADPDSHTCP